MNDDILVVPEKFINLAQEWLFELVIFGIIITYLKNIDI